MSEIREPTPLTLIREHPDNWCELMREKRVKLREKGSLALLHYDTAPDWTDLVVLESRGIIIDTETMSVVCRPFDKFFNVEEKWSADIDWKIAQVQQKVDGSIIKLYWYKDRWHFATNECIDAEDAVTKVPHMNYMDVIRSAKNYRNLVDALNGLDKGNTYLFELVSDATRVVVDYGFTYLYHIGTRNNATGQEYNVSIGIRKPDTYLLRSLSDCVEAVKEMNPTGQITEEGFVVVDRKWNRVKIKSPAYVAMSRAIDNGRMTFKRYLEVRYGDGINVDAMPLGTKTAYLYYEYKMTELLWKVDSYIRYARALYEEYDHDRKAVAGIIKRDDLASIGFSALGNERTAEEIMDDQNNAWLMRRIADYQGPEKTRKETALCMQNSRE